MTDLQPADRAFLDENLARYGSAWAGGLAALERDFELVAESKRREYLLHLTLRAVPRVRYTVEVTKRDGGMTFNRAELPDAPSLDEGATRIVGAVLRRAEELWLVEPLNGEVQCLDVRGGLDALRGGRELQTRRLDPHAALYLTEPDGFGELLCVWIDLQREALDGVAWVDLPPAEGGMWLSPATVAYLDGALRENGDFGVYGNVQDGLRSLVATMEVRMRRSEAWWDVSAYPRDGHGHFLHFPIHVSTGEVGAAAAGHIAPMPEGLLGGEESGVEPDED
jgi:hypothetical protein